MKKYATKQLRLYPVPVAVRAKAYIWSRLIAWIAVSNPAEGIDIRLLQMFVV